jgi:hypothetical protein
MSAISGAGAGGFPSDGKNQISISGRIVPSFNCVTILEALTIDVSGPLPSENRVCLSSPANDGTFKFICVTDKGVYNVNLRNASRGILVQSQSMNAANVDRFSFDFEGCSKN